MKDQMLNEIIKTWGMEHEYTIEFATAMETTTETELKELYEDIIDRPIYDEEDEEYYEPDYDKCGYDPYMGYYSFDC